MNHTIVMIEYRPVSQQKWYLLTECNNARVIFETFDEAMLGDCEQALSMIKDFEKFYK